MPAGEPRFSRVAMRADGSSVVVWESPTSPGGDADGSIQARRFTDTPGLSAGEAFQVNTTTAGVQVQPDVAVLADSGFVVSWSNGATGPHPGARFRRFGPGGEPYGPDQRLDPAATSEQSLVRVAADGTGGFGFAWQDGGGIRASRYAGDGTPIFEAIEVETSGGSHDEPAIGFEPDGAMVVVWSVDVHDSDEAGAILARRFAPDGTPRGDDFLLNSHTEGWQDHPALAVDADGDGLAAWDSDDFGAADPTAAIVAQRLLGPQAAHWRFDEGSGTTLADSAGLLPDTGTAVGGFGSMFVPGPRPATLGTAIELDGVDDHVTLDASADLAIDGTEVAISAWVRLDVLPSQMDEQVGSILQHAGQDPYALEVNRTVAELRFSATNANGLFGRPGIPEALLEVGRWMHVLGTYDGRKARIYLDGVLVDTATVSNDILPPVPVASTLEVPAIGRDGDQDRFYFEGAIDELVVWRRVPTAAQIALMLGPPLLSDGFESGNRAAWLVTPP
jgi:hypothetical protein